MASREHTYQVQLDWRGNLGSGTARYSAYSRAHEISAAGKPTILGSADRAFRGDADRYNPEELLVSALAACHMLAFLHLCADAGVVVVGYQDRPIGVMVTEDSGMGRFREVVLHPSVTLAADADAAAMPTLHARAHALCFIANSVNFPVRCEPQVERAVGASAASR
jgi:organic hydroperoxide reductase OsmC/OhrA